MQDIAISHDANARDTNPHAPLRHEDRIDAQGLNQLIHSGVDHLDADEDYWFRLRGHNLNPLVDAASSLLGMVVRVRQLGDVDDIERLYQQVVDEISAIEIELTEQGYDRPTLLAYRYVLCSFIDEAVMLTPWGQQSKWAEHSLLTRFHNETWGGEKVFSILARLQQEPQRYRDMLAFIYLCLCLGFEGRYRVMTDGREEYENVVRTLGDQLAALSDTPDDQLTQPLDNVMPGHRRGGQSLPVWAVFALFGAALVAIYAGLSWSLDQQAEQVSALLDQIFR
ncbi:type IV / VI secretion system, DotU family domain protein [Litchfieldella anticariensis FP35 = DSM 16096]|uniref:Type IV / VI secretion system, DotU family domain protein n=1 Tax=Litchfieldella anticariensis (strain DSM 16096 / CECT 5854 / CIP 108499 / LMG 22089 / FP35) TaxID=1121939 RepID=S2L669_LITA3|nr:type IVB secretion system protein IcmH/DotU [Halomonas anticariensis]EPC00236.1 type IV / VI secretion system, DotU family domain protein [Halomonas anticariensis FP35 = DSM 16096]